MGTSTHYRVVVLLVAGAMILAVAGCCTTTSTTGTTETSEQETAAVSIEATEGPSEEESLGLGGGAGVEEAEPAGPELGPKNAAKSWAYLKKMVENDGYWYVTVDYIQVKGPEENLHFVNENPLLRTFPLKAGAKLLLLRSPGAPIYKKVSPSAFKAWQSKPGDEVVEVTPSGGYVTQLKQWWAP